MKPDKAWFCIVVDVSDSVAKRRTMGGNLGGRPARSTASQIRTAARLVEAEVPTA
ncbi:MAG: hypothetical protein ABW204_02005 [Microbacteriaceae bacterium]